MMTWIRRIFGQARRWLMWLGVAVLVLAMVVASSFRGCGRTTPSDQTAELQKQIADLRQLLEAKQDAKPQPIVVNVPEPKVDLGKFVKGVREGPGHGTLEIYPDGAAIATSATPVEETETEKVRSEEFKRRTKELQNKIKDTEKSLILAKIRARTEFGADERGSWATKVNSLASDLDVMRTELRLLRP